MVRTKAIGGGAMQEKEMMTQPRTDTAVLIFKCKAVAAAVGSCELEELLDEVVDTLAQQEATIRHLRVELCKASAILMTHLETIKTIQAEVDLLNKRTKR
jgi:ABC-type transporter Mla subunit MlaD